MPAKKILILNVDDNDGARHAKTRLLQNAGFQVAEASNGTDALTMVGRLLPRLVLLDVRLPDIDGREVCRQIKANSSTSMVTVIQMSAAFISTQDIASGLESGAEHYITAPYQPDDLVSAVRLALR
jgi:DNA-binding response OmpR family regulator